MTDEAIEKLFDKKTLKVLRYIEKQKSITPAELSERFGEYTEMCVTLEENLYLLGGDGNLYFATQKLSKYLEQESRNRVTFHIAIFGAITGTISIIYNIVLTWIK